MVKDRDSAGRLKPNEVDLAQVRAILASVRQTGLLDSQFASQVDFQVVVSCGTGWGKVHKDMDCSEFAAHATVSVSHLPNVHIHIFHGNAYEYPALHWMWRLGCSSDPEQLFLYFHSKGTKYKSEMRNPTRISWEMLLFNEVVAPWRSYVEKFAERSDLDSASFGVSSQKFHWHNFYYMRAAFLRRLAEPDASTTDRWYYEKTWVRSMPADPDTSACSGSAPVFGQPVAKNIKINVKRYGQNKAFQVLGCSMFKVSSSVAINKQTIRPRAQALRERVLDYQMKNKETMTLAELVGDDFHAKVKTGVLAKV